MSACAVCECGRRMAFQSSSANVVCDSECGLRMSQCMVSAVWEGSAVHGECGRRPCSIVDYAGGKSSFVLSHTGPTDEPLRKAMKMSLTEALSINAAATLTAKMVFSREPVENSFILNAPIIEKASSIGWVVGGIH